MKIYNGIHLQSIRVEQIIHLVDGDENDIAPEIMQVDTKS